MKTITVKLDDITLGDLEILDGNSFTAMMTVFDKCVRIEGIPDEEQPTELRKLHWSRLQEIGQGIRDAVNVASAPVVNGKN